MKKKSKLKTIYQAFTEDIDTTTEMYQERLEICNSCEYLSENIEEEDIKTSQKLTRDTICQGSPVCTACGCCYLKKIGQKTETCGLNEINMIPKWNAVKVETSRDRELDIEILNKTAISVNLTPKGDAFIIELGEITDSVKEVELIISRKSELNISSIKAACSCTIPIQNKIDDNTVKITAKINTAGFIKDAKFTKSLNIYYFVSSAGTRTGIIKLTGLKK